MRTALRFRECGFKMVQEEPPRVCSWHRVAAETFVRFRFPLTLLLALPAHDGFLVHLPEYSCGSIQAELRIVRRESAGRWSLAQGLHRLSVNASEIFSDDNGRGGGMVRCD